MILARVNNWRFFGPVIRDLMQNGYHAVKSQDDRIVEIVKREHTEKENPSDAAYYLFQDRDFIFGVARIQDKKVTNVAIKERFKKHEKKFLDLLG